MCSASTMFDPGFPDAAIANATQVPVNDPLLVVHCLYFLPLPQGQGSFRPILAISATSIGRRDPCTESCWAMPGFMTFCSPSIAILRRAAEREARQIDETLFFDLYAMPAPDQGGRRQAPMTPAPRPAGLSPRSIGLRSSAG